MLSNIRRGQGGCRYCADPGFDYTGPAVLYVITHRALGAHKIGIAGESARNNRLTVHRRYGWEVFKVARFVRGADAHLVEQAVLRRLRSELGLGQYLTVVDMPQRGETETTDAAEISLGELWQLVKVETARAKPSAG
ncbi:hypothetical protein [Streptomyces melanogenes]|uniref:hypothetical protein n=1 Tax=Streptomyces melanogenes TaxID=67326 RepID=UPI0037B46689